ncbi:MAG: hypothetical protein R6W85_07265 [Gillisia sp.]
MKKILLLCIIVISSNNLWSQNIYEIDSIISVKIPGEEIKIDSLKNNKIIIQFHSTIGNSEFLVQKELFENDSINIYDSNLPYDLKSLGKYYKSLAKTYVNNSKFKLESEKLIEKDSLKGYHLKFKDSSNSSIYEIEYFLINKYIYSFEYKTNTEFENIEKEPFFNSIKIKSDKKLNQFTGKTQVQKSAYNFGYKIGHTAKHHPSYLWIAVGGFLAFIVGIIVFFVRR